MTEPLPTPEEAELERIKEAAAKPPEPVPDAEGLPDDTADGPVSEDDGSTVDHHEGEP